MQISTIGIKLAKTVFQLHAVANGKTPMQDTHAYLSIGRFHRTGIARHSDS